jgi:hypothetical protein
MKKFLLLLIFLLLPVAASAASSSLAVPFIPELPDGRIAHPWIDGCEEASIVMIEQYYQGITTTPRSEAKKIMQNYFNIENRIFGSNANTDAKQTARLINEYSKYFESQIINNPTLDQIKEQIGAGKPVIALVYGFNLDNPRIPFARYGSYYHTFVIKGYDDSSKEFIVNDDGDYEQGLDLRYKYDTIMGALHDYNHKTKRTDGTPVVLFSTQRMLVKTAVSNRIYLIRDNQKHHIVSPDVFNNHSWKWGLVQVVTKDWLDKFPAGGAIVK